MGLDRQLEELINEATDYGVSPWVVERAIAPVLGSYAQQLQQEQYYIMQNLAEEWVLTTIANPKSQETKTVIYAFVSVQDAATFGGKTVPDALAMPIDTVQLLFRLFSLEGTDSIIFLENSQNLSQGIEVKRSYLIESIQQQLRSLKDIPTDIA